MLDSAFDHGGRQWGGGGTGGHQQRQKMLGCRVGAARMRCDLEYLFQSLGLATLDRVPDPAREFGGVVRDVRVIATQFVKVMRRLPEPTMSTPSSASGASARLRAHADVTLSRSGRET